MLSIGAGQEQVFSILEARALGFTVIAVDGNANAVGFQYANYSFPIDLAEERQIIELAKKYDVKFIIPSPIGRFLVTVGAVNDALNLPGVSKVAARILADKHLFSQLLNKLNMFTPTHRIINKPNLFTIMKEINTLSYPCILKPVNGSGSRGVVTLYNNFNNDNLIEQHVSSLLTNENTVIEEYVIGTEYGVDCLIRNDNLEIVAVREKIMTNLPYRQEIGYITSFDIELEKNIAVEIQKIIDELKLNNCIMQVDLILLSNNFVYIIEAAARPSGLRVTQNLLPFIVEESPVSILLKEVIKEKKSELSKKNSKFYGLFFFDFKEEGVLYRKPSSKEISKLKVITEYECNLNKGDKITVVKDGLGIYQRGYFIIEGDTKEEVIKNRIKILELFLIKGGENNEL
ncbi:ATP-grasp domain-containing protein [Lysinibacillus sp. Y5S-8]|uniref:ATP-grasp domain-containing protein n=1 Tax=Lysinibacillus sp. Y5S-8 TaxID=3122488 RepID=UPI0030CE90A4